MNDVEAVELAGYHCPKCDYDLRGLPELRCPECGTVLSPHEVAAYGERRWPPQRFFRALILATIPWFIAYVFSDAIHNTTDRAELSMLTAPFLILPLHLVLLALAAGSLEASSTREVKRVGAVLVIVVWMLILGHIAITVWTL